MRSDKIHFAYLNGEMLLLKNAYLHVSDLSIHRGYGVFDFFKCQKGQPVFLENYLDRFYASASTMELKVPLSKVQLKSSILQLTEKNALPLSGVKMILTGGYSANGYDPLEPNLLLIEQPLSLPTQSDVEKGIKVITHDYVREIPLAKTINYSMGISLIREIRQQKAADVLYHREGVVTELPRSNFFIVRQDDTVVTPAKDVLMGITRKNVLELAGKIYKTEEGTVTLEDIAQAKEAFTTSTTKRVLPIVQVDDKIIGTGKPGAISLSLLEKLISFEEQEALA